MRGLREDDSGILPSGVSVARVFQGRLAPLLVSLAIVAADRVTKVAVQGSVRLYLGVSIIPGWLRLIHAENPGAAFSILAEGNPILRGVVLIGVSTAVLIFVAQALWSGKGAFGAPLTRAGLAFVLGGAAGNLYDRVTRGSVTDFIEVYHGGWTFPAFNVADSAITIGAALLLLDVLFSRRVKPE